MKILAIETSTKYLSVAVMDNDKTLASHDDKNELQHSKLLIPTIERVLKEAGLNLKSIDAIALSIGPGSFTGLRIGVATAKGINMALRIPIVSVPTLDAVAYNFRDEKEDMLCPILDAKKGKVYAALYRDIKGNLPGRISDYMLTDVDSLLKKIDEPTLAFGDGATLYENDCKRNNFISISTKDWLPKAEVVGILALAKAKKGEFENPDKLSPMYLHSQYCQVKGSK